MNTTNLKIRTIGVFSINDPNGVDLTPRGNKECALFAYLVCSENGNASRNQIYNLLWSDRSAEQQSTSLRRALSNVRKSLGDWSFILTSNKRELCLDTDQLSVDIFSTDQSFSQVEAGDLFLDSLTIRDKKYKKWREDFVRRLTRNNNSQNVILTLENIKPETEHRDNIYVEVCMHEDLESNPVVLDLTNSLIEYLYCTCSYEIVDGRYSRRDNDNIRISNGLCNYLVRLTYVVANCELLAHISLLEPTSLQVIWLHKFKLNDQASNHQKQCFAEPIQLLYDAIVLNQLTLKTSNSKNNLGIGTAIGLKGFIFPGSYDIDHMASSLNDSIELKPTGVSHILKAAVEAFRVGEKFENLDKELIERVDFNYRKAFELHPSNPFVLSFGGHIQGFLKNNLSTALEFTSQSTNLYANNPFLWAIQSTALSYAQKYNLSLKSAIKAWELGRCTSGRYLYAETLATAYCAVGEFEKSKCFSQLAAEQLPEFRPVLDCLFVSSVKCGDYKLARKTYDKLLLRAPYLNAKSVTSGQYPLRSSSSRTNFIDALHSIDAE